MKNVVPDWTDLRAEVLNRISDQLYLIFVRNTQQQ